MGKHIPYSLMKIPSECDLPKSRIDFFWREIDADHSGQASFGEFLSWWLRRSETLMPYDDFYRQIRCLPNVKYDPPVYLQPAETADEELAAEDDEVFARRDAQSEIQLSDMLASSDRNAQVRVRRVAITEVQAYDALAAMEEEGGW